MDGDREPRTPNRILKAKEVLRMLRIGKNTLYEWCGQGLIPHKRIGGKIDETTGKLQGGLILFSEKRINEWLENSDNDTRIVKGG